MENWNLICYDSKGDKRAATSSTQYCLEQEQLGLIIMGTHFNENKTQLTFGRMD